MVKFGILGPIELRAGDRRLPAGGPRQLALLAFLLLHANRAVSTDQLQDALWSGQQRSGAAQKSVQMAIARLRKTLEPLGPSDRSVLQTVSGGYLLAVAPGELDAEAFEDGVTSGRAMLGRGDAAGAAEALRAALALWRGPALPEVAFEDFAAAEIRRLEELRFGALESRIEADLALGRHAAVLGEVQTLSLEHPERERLCEQVMLALYRCGRQSDALDAYRRVSAHLVGELGIDPGPALQALQRAVLEQAPWLSLDVAASLVRRSSGRARAAAKPAGAYAFALPPTLRHAEREAFVGRDEALAQLGRCFEQAVLGSRRIVMLCGEPGIGKTRLATEFALQAHAGGAGVLHGRCDEETLLPHQPFIEALRHYVLHSDAATLARQVQLISGELRRVVPELAERVPGLAEPLSGDPEGARYRLFEAVAALLCEAAQTRPLLLVLDDLHWADEATLLLLKYVARHPREARLMIVGTYRDIDVQPDHPLNGVLADLAREQILERLPLAPLDEGAVSELVGWHTHNRASPELHRIVFEETEGNAFFVVEILRHLAESGQGEPERVRPRLPLPEGVRDLIGRRLARLGPQTTRVLETAAVLGRSFDYDLLALLCDVGEDELVDLLERAIRAQIIEESESTIGRYAFSHTLVRGVLYGTLTATRRALLHRRAANAIVASRGAGLEPFLGELANHFGQAGSPEDLAKAIAYRARAGERAVTLLAYEQAAAHYGQAIELLDRGGAGAAATQRCDLTIARGEAERMAGDPSYRRTLLEGARIALELGDVERLARAALANNRGSSSSTEGIDRERVAMLEAALDALDERDSETRAVVLVQLAVELAADADWRRRGRLADEALAMARRLGDARTLARVLTMRALARWNPRTLADRNVDLIEAWRLASGIDEPLLAGYAAFLAGDTAVEAGELERSGMLLDSLAAFAGRLGQPIMEWYEAIARAKRCVVVGSPKDAERLAFAAYETGQRAGQPDAWAWMLGQLFVARFLQGTLDAGEPDLAALFAEPGSAPPVGPEFTPGRSIPLMVGAAMSATLCELGRPADGRRRLELVMDEFDDLPQDFSTLTVIVWSSVACAQLGDRARAERLCALLEPYRGQFVNTGGSWFGAVVHHVATLRAALGEAAESDALFAEAERAYEALGAPAWLARCRLDRATALLARGDLAAAGVLLDSVLEAARELELPRMQRRAEGLRERAAVQRR